MYKYIKRFLDILFSIILFLLLLPIMIIVGIICKIVTGHVIFKQNRDGLDKKSFVMYKFSSIKPDFKYSKVMNIIRSFGLDEISQLINVLKGDMSFIGPRPFITDEILPSYPDTRTYKVKPGLISLATANGRRKISHERRLELDLEYALNVSFKLDIYILFKSILVILKQNVNGDGNGQTS